MASAYSQATYKLHEGCILELRGKLSCPGEIVLTTYRHDLSQSSYKKLENERLTLILRAARFLSVGVLYQFFFAG